MQQENRLTFYFFWHLAAGLLAIYATVFVCQIFKAYPIYYVFAGLTWEASSHIMLGFMSMPFFILSCIIYNAMDRFDLCLIDTTTCLYTLLAVLGCMVLLLLTLGLVLPVLALLFGECYLLMRIDRAWDRPFAEKRKRKLNA